MKHSISLSVVLALGAVAAASDMPEKPAPDLALKDTTPIWVKPVVDPSHQAMKQQIEQAKRSGLPIVPAAGLAQHPLGPAQLWDRVDAADLRQSLRGEASDLGVARLQR